MPSGYTAKMYDGEDQSFPDFLLNCARAFGALVMLRDSPNAPIPEKIEPSTKYHDEALESARETLQRVKPMLLEEATQEAQRQYESLMARWEEGQQEKIELRERYLTQRARAEAWEPPTEKHEGLKKFMIDQLNQSIDFDCGSIGEYAPKKLSGEEWKEQQLQRAYRDLEYHAKEIQREREQAAEKTAWLQALRESVEKEMARA